MSFFDIYLELDSVLAIQGIMYFIVLFYLLEVARVDTLTMTIPNKLNAAFYLIGLVSVVFFGLLSGDLTHVLWQAIKGSAVGFLIVFVPAFILNQPMGGDIKCFATLGLFLQAKGVFVLLFIACALIIVTKGFSIVFSKGDLFYKKASYDAIKKEKFAMGPWILKAYILSHFVSLSYSLFL